MLRFFLSIILLSQSFWAFSQDCNCTENLDILNRALKENYPGYALKTNRPEFARYWDSLKQRLPNAQTDLTCYKLLKGLISFFKDPHLNLNVTAIPANASRIKAMFSEADDIQTLPPPTNLPAIKSDPICGVWEIKGQGAYYKFDLQPSEDGKMFIGRLISSDTLFWMPGQIKCIIYPMGRHVYAAQVHTRDHTPSRFHFRLSEKNLLEWGSLGIYQRFTPDLDSKQLDSLVKFKRNIFITQPTPNIVYLRIPSFDPDNFNVLSRVLKEDMPEKMNDKTLVIDLRGNSGGSTLVSSQLLKYVYEKPIVMKGARFYSSAQNIADYEKRVLHPAFNSIDKQFLSDQINKLKANPNSLVSFTESKTTTMDSGIVPTKQVFILTNGFCASATEYFILQATQSSKVKTVGQKTRGAIDYTDLGYPRPLPCSIFYYQSPTTVSDRIPDMQLDNIGIQPSILLPEEVDALEYVIGKASE